MNDLDKKNLQYLTKMLIELNKEFKTIRESDKLSPRRSEVLDNIRRTNEVKEEIRKIESPRAKSFGKKLLIKNSKTI